MQEVCDHVGIIFQGKMVKEGRLDDLIAIEDQTEIVMKNASPELIERIRTMIDQEDSTTLMRMGKPRTTLERLFLRETQSDKK